MARQDMPHDLDAGIADYTGCTAMPLLADAHVHLGLSDGVTERPSFHGVEFIAGQLRHYLQCGVGHVLSLGTDQPWLTELLQRRNTEDSAFADTAHGYSAGIGFGAVGGWPPDLTLPVLRSRPTAPDDASDAVRRLAENHVRVLKIWVDDFGKKVRKIPLPIVEAIIAEARQRGLTTFAHVYFLEDAVQLVRAGIHVLAHSVRDQSMDRGFAGEMARRRVILVPTLAREEAEVAFSRADNAYLADPLFQACAGDRLDALRAMGESGDTAQLSRKLKTALANFRLCHESGVRICMGTDSGFKESRCLLLPKSGRSYRS